MLGVKTQEPEYAFVTGLDKNMAPIRVALDSIALDAQEFIRKKLAVWEIKPYDGLGIERGVRNEVMEQTLIALKQVIAAEITAFSKHILHQMKLDIIEQSMQAVAEYDRRFKELEELTKTLGLEVKPNKDHVPQVTFSGVLKQDCGGGNRGGVMV